MEGDKLIRTALDSGWKAESIWSDHGISFPLKCPFYLVPKSLYSLLSPTKSGQPPLAVFQCENKPQRLPLAPMLGRYLLLDQVQEPGNAGALVRAAVAFGFDAILWNRPCVFPFHHACIRASAGCVFQARHYLFENYQALLAHHPIIGSDASGSFDLQSAPWPDHFVLAMGNEGHGLSQEIRDHLRFSVRIPLALGVESLNVAGAAHILMYHLRRAKRP